MKKKNSPFTLFSSSFLTFSSYSGVFGGFIGVRNVGLGLLQLPYMLSVSKLV